MAIAQDELVILAIVQWYTVGEEVEGKIFRSAVNKKPYRIIQYSLGVDKPLTDIPEEITNQVDGLFLVRHRFRQEDVGRFPRLKCIVRTGVGYDRIDRKAANGAGITVHNVPDYGTAEIADHAIALAVSLRRGIIIQHDFQRSEAAAWKFLDGPQGYDGQIIQRSKGRVFGIIGLGRIGTAVALRAKAFEHQVIFYDPFVSNGMDKAVGIERVRTLEALLQRADIVSLHCPNTPDTRHMINASTLSLMKPDAALINTARGELVDLEALYDALRSGKLAAAGLDVIEVEPPKDPLPRLIKAYREREEWLMGRLVVTPHIAYYSKESVVDIQKNSAETMRDVLFDGLSTNLIAPESW